MDAQKEGTFLFAGEHFYSVDSQLNSLHLKKQNLMNRGIGYLILVTANTSGFTQEQGQNLKLPLRKAGRWVTRKEESEQTVLCRRHHISGIPGVFSSQQSFTVLGQAPGLTSSALEASHLWRSRSTR